MQRNFDEHLRRCLSSRSSFTHRPLLQVGISLTINTAMANESLIGAAQLQATLEKMQQTAPYAAATALTGVAFEIRKQVQSDLPSWVHLTRQYLPSQVIFERATASNLQAVVGFHKRVSFANLLEEGGTRTPTEGHRAITVPVDIKLNQSGGISNANRPSQILQKAGVFSKAIGTVGGIWQETKRIPLRLLYVYKQSTRYNKHFFKFRQTAEKVAAEQYPIKFQAALEKLLSR